MDNEEINPGALLVEQTTKLTDWANEPDIRLLKKDVEDSRPHQQTHIVRVDNWLDQMNLTGQAKLPKSKNRSRMQPKLIRKQAEWRYGSLSEPFLASDKLFALSPRSWEDRPAIQQNELLVNWQFDEKLDKVVFIDQFTRRLVNEGTVVVRVGWERETKKEMVKVPVWSYFLADNEADIQKITEASQLEIDNPAEFAKLPEEIREAVRYSQEAGEPMIAQITGEEEVEQEKVLKNQPTAEVVDIRNLVVDATCGGDLSKAMFMAYSSEVTRGSLEQDSRYRNLNMIPVNTSSVLAQPDHVAQGQPEVNFQDKMRQKLILNEYWGYFDIDNSGHLTPILVCWIGDVIVRMEVNPFPDGKPPFVIVPMLPIDKSFYGECDAELLEDNQKIVGAVTRGMIDLMARSANAQRGMAKGMLDVTNRRRFDSGEDYEFNGNIHPSNGIVEHKFPEIPNSAMNMVQMHNMEAESLTGVKMYSDGGISGASLGKVVAGIRGALDAASKREMGILRRMAKGMAQIGSKIISMNHEFLSAEEVVRLTNEEFITIKRDELYGNFDTKVEISTVEENEAKANRLEFMLQTMGNTGDPGITKIILMEIARLRHMPDLAHQIKTYVPQPDPIAQKRAELELREYEAKIVKLEAEAMEVQTQAQLNQAKAREALARADMTDLNYVEQETGTKHARDIQKTERQAEANQDLVVTKAILGQRNGATPDGKIDTSPTRENIGDAIGYNAATRT
jgi:hypothetical protein